jgi:uncharacterized membrane protein YraQ (UPF0718 family)
MSNVNEYDVRSAVTFLLVGLGLGAVLAVFLGPSTGRRMLLERERSV